ncbi:LssY C-terminal domain-containing protein [Gemmata sp. JC717]|uniref:LssY C-terminal domain-containing protein n=1 Tax=Gemmata algarum TaxID=2975278 RepID=UPI0021BB5228|nr:LssY C-terminal domain-containing protein [Gemmata algarum]MDY3553685.1 LssY C-terminal domain-containing protein [Gemmata algarum]
MFTAVLCAALVVPPAEPVLTSKRDGTPGDPVNLRLVATREELVRAFCAAGWVTADPVTVRSSLRIGASVVLNRPYPSAPVSDLYLFGRAQDVAFERALGSARTRHHVRFWRAGCDATGRPVWLGAGTFDVRVGRGPATGKLTHRIAPDVDTERDGILADLARGGGLSAARVEPRGGPFSGRNGEGDRYFTDGGVGAGVLTSGTGCQRTLRGGQRR